MPEQATKTPIDTFQQLAWMREQLARCSHGDWSMTIEPGLAPDGPATLVVRYTAEDSRNPGQQIALTARRSIGPYFVLGGEFEVKRFRADLRITLLHGVYEHELDETLRCDGQLLNDPHAAPDRWHCATCGGVGPIKHEGSTYTCPGCHTEAEEG